MKILTCIKQSVVPDHLQQADMPLSDDSGMNRYDKYALEEALLIREAFGEVIVDVITAGPEAAASALKRAVGMGADYGIHILTKEVLNDPYATASLIAEYAKEKEYDLILTGVMSEDLMQGQVGPMIAELLFLPCATSVIDAQLLPEEGKGKVKVKVEREIEGGEREVLELKLPALLSVQSGINDPRYPALSHLLRAARKGAETIPAESLSSPDFRQSVVNMVLPPKDRQGLIIEGSAGEKAQSLGKIFREKGFVRTGG